MSRFRDSDRNERTRDSQHPSQRYKSPDRRRYDRNVPHRRRQELRDRGRYPTGHDHYDRRDRKYRDERVSRGRGRMSWNGRRHRDAPYNRRDRDLSGSSSYRRGGRRFHESRRGGRSAGRGYRGRRRFNPNTADPASVPRQTNYFLHDDRERLDFDSEREQRLSFGRTTEADRKDVWGHDMYDKINQEETEEENNMLPTSAESQEDKHTNDQDDTSNEPNAIETDGGSQEE